jgi:hypothetical protein
LVTLKNIFSVVGTYKPYPTRFPLHLDGFVLIHTRILWVSKHGNSSLAITLATFGLVTFTKVKLHPLSSIMRSVDYQAMLGEITGENRRTTCDIK